MRTHALVVVAGIVAAVLAIAIALARDAAPGKLVVERPEWLRAAAVPVNVDDASTAGLPPVAEADNPMRDLAPPPDLARALMRSRVPAEFVVQTDLTPEIAVELSRSLTLAGEKLWMSRKLQQLTHEREGRPLSDNYRVGQFLLASWPLLPAWIAHGGGRVYVVRRSPRTPPKVTDTCMSQLLSDTRRLVTSVYTENWALVMEFTEQNNPNPELFAELFPKKVQ